MGNYQLYRTNVLLGGQMKYDIILKSTDDDKLEVEDFHLNTISPETTCKNDYVSLINYKHQDNIKMFYNDNSDIFYDNCDNYILSNDSIVNLNNKYKHKPYNDIYEMGCRRMNYSTYNTEFEFLCPVWLESVKSTIELKFKLYSDPEQTNQISEKIVKFDLRSDNSDTYHSKFTKYLKNYLDDIKILWSYREDNQKYIERITDWVFNINKNNSEICGVDVKSGDPVIMPDKRLFNDLTSISRPMMDFDNIIISRLKDNKLITRQLFNLNLCFNLKDIISDNILHIGYRTADHWHLNIVVSIDGQDLEMYDIFSNYKHIGLIDCSPVLLTDKHQNDNGPILQPKYTYNEYNDNNFNVLKYLRDYDSIDLMGKNTITQSIIHWGYCGFDNIMFEYYGGSSSYIKDIYTDTPRYINHIPANIPDITSSDYSKNINQYWCNSMLLRRDHIESSKGIKELFKNPGKYKHLFSKFNSNCTVKNIKYNNGGTTNIDINVMILIDDISQISIEKYLIKSPNIKVKEFGESDKFGKYISIIDNSTNNTEYYVILLITPDKLDIVLPLKNTIKYLNKICGEEHDIISESLFNILNYSKPAQLSKINFNKGITIYRAPSPSEKTKEITYYKNNNSSTILRYDGKIKPFFIKRGDFYKNNKYIKRSTSTILDDGTKIIDIYNDYVNTKYKPKYPSINYYPYDEIEQTYDKPTDGIEYHNFCYNKLQNIYPNINIKLCISKNEDIKEEVGKYLDELYGGRGDECLDYIKKLYDIKYDYISTESEPNKYTYNINIKLK